MCAARPHKTLPASLIASSWCIAIPSLPSAARCPCPQLHPPPAPTPGPAPTESERRLHMVCTHGCSILYHYPGCWRTHKEGCRALHGMEVKDVVYKEKVGAGCCGTGAATVLLLSVAEGVWEGGGVIAGVFGMSRPQLRGNQSFFELQVRVSRFPSSYLSCSQRTPFPPLVLSCKS